ncbi:MAG: hypothetical protein F6K10_12185 [Moorea sp. SIO2B7]|nr:hypothetical protein [Moorena sp. SIO2B7]
MSVNRIGLLILILALVGSIIFVVQNQVPVSLVFLNIDIPIKLSIAVWMLIFAVAGILASLVLQLLSSLTRKAPVKDFYTEESEPYSPSPRRWHRSQERDKELNEGRSQVSNPSVNYESDWETPDDDDWDREESTTETPPTGEIFDRSLTEEQSESHERVQKPKTSSHSGSVYSYGYREPGDTGVGKAEPVVDANYRVIKPPHRHNIDEQTERDEEEDWI